MVHGLNNSQFGANGDVSEISELLAQGDEVSLQTLIFLVGVSCIKHQNEAVRLQLQELEDHNKLLAKFNDILGKLLAFKGQQKIDIKPEDPVTLTDEVKKALTDAGIDPDSVKNYGDLTAAIEKVRAQIDRYNSIGQTFAIRLQMEMNTLQVFSDMTTNSVQTQFNSLKSIVRNLV